MADEKWFDWDTEKAVEPQAEAQAESEPSPAPAPEPEFGVQAEAAPLDLPPAELALPTESPPEPEAPAIAASAERPFTLWIEGKFTDEDRQKIEDLISRENFGIRAVDLEMQWEEGRVLLPQISEYAAMRVAQVLRESSLTLSLAPGAEPPAAEAALETSKFGGSPPHAHPAEQIPVSALAGLGPEPHLEEWETLDTLLATGILKEPEWRASQTDAFTRMVEALKRELRYRAHVRRAEALIHFKAEVLPSPWLSESECRIQVSAIAVRKPILPAL